MHALVWATLALVAATLGMTQARAAERRLLVPPGATSPALAGHDEPHLVVYDPDAAPGLLAVWLPGTGGRPSHGPQALFATVRESGHRLIALSYLNTPAVGQVCIGMRLRSQPDCAARMRQQRVWGDEPAAPIADAAEHAIVPRLVALLRHLAQAEPGGGWQEFLEGPNHDSPRWSRLLLLGQSQGGGMAAFIAQTRSVAGVVVFSGGWDHAARGEIAGWYGRTSATPAERWHATFHVQEPQADTMARIYQRLGVPTAQIHALDQPVAGRLAHGEGITNTAYRALWQRMLTPVSVKPAAAASRATRATRPPRAADRPSAAPATGRALPAPPATTASAAPTSHTA